MKKIQESLNLKKSIVLLRTEFRFRLFELGCPQARTHVVVKRRKITIKKPKETQKKNINKNNDNI